MTNKYNIHITDHRINHCECACHYFPMLSHKEPCCDASKLFEIKVNTEKKVKME